MSIDRHLTYRLHLLSKLSDVKSKQIYQEAINLSLAEARLLSAIGSFAPLSINELAFRSNLTKGQASRAAQLMVEKNYVSKKDAKDDGRGVELSLTQKGKVTFEKLLPLIENRNKEIFGCLSESEKKHLDQLIDRVINHLS